MRTHRPGGTMASAALAALCTIAPCPAPAQAQAVQEPSPPGVGLRDRNLGEGDRGTPGVPSSLAGVILTHVYLDGPAARAGLLEGDVVVSVDGTSVLDTKSLGTLLRAHGAGETATFGIVRAGEPREVGVVLAPKALFLPPGCEHGDGAACTDLAILHYYGTGVPRDLGQYVSYLERGCSALQDRTACKLLADAYQWGQGVEPDATRTRTLLIRACELGGAASCLAAGLMLEDGVGGPPDAATAVAVYTKGCDANELPACVNLGLAYLEGRGTAPDPGRASAILRRACEQGLTRACTVLAAQMLEGEAGEGDDGLALLEQSCANADGVACVKLADAYSTFREDTPPDHARALVLYDKACDCGVAKGCVYAGMSYETGEGAESKDPLRANALYLKACEALDEAAGCTLAGIQFARGKGVAPDKERAMALLELSCRRGDDNACGWLRRLKGEP